MMSGVAAFRGYIMFQPLGHKCKVFGLGLRAQGLKFRILGSGSRAYMSCRAYGVWSQIVDRGLRC